METKQVMALYDRLTESQKEAFDLLLVTINPETKSDWISVADAAGILGISPQTLRVKISQGVIPSRNVGTRKTVVERKTVERLAQLR